MQRCDISDPLLGGFTLNILLRELGANGNFNLSG